MINAFHAFQLCKYQFNLSVYSKYQAPRHQIQSKALKKAVNSHQLESLSSFVVVVPVVAVVAVVTVVVIVIILVRLGWQPNIEYLHMHCVEWSAFSSGCTYKSIAHCGI